MVAKRKKQRNDSDKNRMVVIMARAIEYTVKYLSGFCRREKIFVHLAVY